MPWVVTLAFAALAQGAEAYARQVREVALIAIIYAFKASLGAIGVVNGIHWFGVAAADWYVGSECTSTSKWAFDLEGMFDRL